MHIPGRAIAKTVMVRVNGDPVMSVIPGSRHLDLNALKKELGTTQVQLMSELEFASAFPDCDIGAMPPLGVLYQLPVYVDDHLAQENEIAFNAGSHRELVRLSYKEFERLQHPRVMHIASQTAAERLQEERAGTDVQSFL
jgi:Ala-tRNA(Pro) deacylase